MTCCKSSKVTVPGMAFVSTVGGAMISFDYICQSTVSLEKTE